jgi:hypothetical protein
MKMRFSYILTHDSLQTAIRAPLAHLCEITRFPKDQWEIGLASTTDATLEYIRTEFPGFQIVHAAECSGQFVLPLAENDLPDSKKTLSVLLSPLAHDTNISAVVGKPNAHLPTLVTRGATAFRRTALERAGGLSVYSGPAADYDLTFRLLTAGGRIEHRSDAVFQSPPEIAQEHAPDAREIESLLAVAKRYLPEHLSQIYWQDWARKYKAIAAQAGKKREGSLAMLLSRLRTVTQAMTDSDPVSPDVLETVFTYRRHAAAIGNWARHASVWRVILGDYSDNLWATYNACRSSGLQMRCVADNNHCFDGVSYRDLPIVHAKRAFEGGGIDGVILTATDAQKIESSYKSLRSHFQGPILKLGAAAGMALAEAA